MKLYIEIIKLLLKKCILRKNNGIIIKEFAQKMGVVYIKLAQILATQNYEKIFTEQDREMLCSICDECSPIRYSQVKQILRQEYGEDLKNIFSSIEKKPIGSASISQVHRAVLKNGEEVAIKVKRHDITKTIESDIAQIRKLVNRYGKVIKLGNLVGGNYALDLYLDWIMQETDFTHEIENIKLYQNFADSVNGKVKGTTKMKVPKIYEKYCTENVIMMELIKKKPISKEKLTENAKKKNSIGINSWMQSTFWAMFHDKQIVFHGDPHPGNLCIDEEGNICFLDMGLVFALSDRDAKLCREFFLAAYTGNDEKLYNMLVIYGNNLSETQKKAFRRDCKRFCQDIKKKEVTYYFMDMIGIVYCYDMVPPDFLFCMAKVFVCLNGIGKFCDNQCTAQYLLLEQTIEFLVNRTLNDGKEMIIQGLHIMPNVLEDVQKYGLVSTFAQHINGSVGNACKDAYEHLKEMMDLLNNYPRHDLEIFSTEKHKQRVKK